MDPTYCITSKSFDLTTIFQISLDEIGNLFYLFFFKELAGSTVLNVVSNRGCCTVWRQLQRYNSQRPGRIYRAVQSVFMVIAVDVTWFLDLINLWQEAESDVNGFHLVHLFAYSCFKNPLRWISREMTFSLYIEHGLSNCFYCFFSTMHEWIVEQPTETSNLSLSATIRGKIQIHK